MDNNILILKFKPTFMIDIKLKRPQSVIFLSMTNKYYEYNSWAHSYNLCKDINDFKLWTYILFLIN